MRFKYILYVVQFLLAVCLLASCKSIKPENPPISSGIILPPSSSSINLPVNIPLGYLEDNLNKEIGSKLFSDRGLSLGSGLFADIDVNRTGKIALSGSDEETLNVKVPMNLKGELKIEKKVFGQVLSTQFPFNENLIPEISFVPQFGENWDLSIQQLQINNWGKSLTYNLLGFQINLEPLVESHLQNVVDNQLMAAGLMRFDFKQMVEETWNSFSKPFTVAQNGLLVHFVANPQKLKVHQEVTANQEIILYMGMEGEMQSSVGKYPEWRPTPLPPVQKNENKANVVDITLPLVFGYEEINKELNQMIPDQPIRIDKNTTMSAHKIYSQQYGDKTLLSIDFTAIRKEKKEIKGTMFFVGKPVFDKEKEAINFQEVEFDVRTGNPFTRMGIRGRKRKIQNQIQKLAVIPLGDFLRKAEKELQQQGYLDTEFASFYLHDPKMEVEGIYGTENDIRVYLRTIGKMDVVLKNLNEK
jgi:hypothetical protein